MGTPRVGAAPRIGVPVVLVLGALLGVPGGERTLDADAAVGFERRSTIALALAEDVDRRTGVGTGGAFFAFASDAAVGA